MWLQVFLIKHILFLRVVPKDLKSMLASCSVGALNTGLLKDITLQIPQIAFRADALTRNLFLEKGHSNSIKCVHGLFHSVEQFQVVPPMEASHNCKTKTYRFSLIIKNIVFILGINIINWN